MRFGRTDLVQLHLLEGVGDAGRRSGRAGGLPECWPRTTRSELVGRRVARRAPGSASRATSRAPRGTSPVRPAGGSRSRRRARRARPPEARARSTGRSGHPRRNDRRPRRRTGSTSHRGRVGLQDNVVPGLMVEHRASRSEGSGRRTVVASLGLASRVSLSASSTVMVRSICKRSAARPKSSVAPTESGTVATGVTWPPTPTARKVTRGSRSLSRPEREERGPGVEAGLAGRQQDLERGRLAERPVGGEGPVIEPLRARAGSRDGPSTGCPRAVSLPASVSSTSVSGRNSRCWRGSATSRKPSSAAPGSLTRSLVSARATGGRRVRSVIGPSQSSPPVRSKVDEPGRGGNS